MLAFKPHHRHWAIALPVAAALALTPRSAEAYRRGGGYHGGWHRGYHGAGAGFATGAIVGLGVGAAVGGASRPFYPPPAADYPPPPRAYYAPPPVAYYPY